MLPSATGGHTRTSPSGQFAYPDEFTITYVVNGEDLPNNHFNPMFKPVRFSLT